MKIVEKQPGFILKIEVSTFKIRFILFLWNTFTSRRKYEDIFLFENVINCHVT